MAAMSLATVSCVEEYQYEKGEADLDGCYGVYFPVQEAIADHTFDPSMDTELVFTVARANSNGAITVPVTHKASHEGIFNVGELVFADGQSETTLVVTFPNSETGTKYSLSLGIEDPMYASKYLDGSTHVDCSVMRVAWLDFLNPVTNQPAVLTFTQGWWGETHTATMKYYEVNGIRTCVATCNETDADGNPIGIWGDTQGITFNFIWNPLLTDKDGNQLIDVPRQYFGFDYADWASKPESEASQGVYFYDWFHYLTTDGGYVGAWADWAAFLEKNPNSYDQSYYDGNGGFYFNLKYQVPALGGGFTPDVFDCVAIADGFTRVDYSLSVTTDYAVEGSLPVEFKVGHDITSINYVVVAGKVNATVMAELLPAVAAGTAENTVTVTEDQMVEDEESKTASFDITCPATGEYTIVAVGLDATGAAQVSTSAVFNYIASDDTTYDVEFTVLTEGTPERYAAEGLNDLNSFAFTVYGGNGVTEARLAIYETATVAKDPAAVIAKIRTSESTLLSEEALAAMNSIAGYSDVVSGLKDGVSYTVVVWATNGIQTKADFAEYTTTKSPEVFKSLGMGLYTEDFLAGLFNGMENLTYEVEIEESVDNPGKYRLVNPYGAAFPYNEEGDYDATQDYYMVINAQDPEGVYIPSQGVGCDWGYGEWTVYSLAANYLDTGKTLAEAKTEGFCGTIQDGVITFPVQSLLITAPALGKYYYANTYGAFKVVLPSAVESEEGTETASVAAVSTVSISGVSAFDCPMTAGYFTGIDYTDNVKTVACEAVPSKTIKEKASRKSSIEKYSVSLK